jgi:hypothetical protein
VRHQSQEESTAMVREIWSRCFQFSERDWQGVSISFFATDIKGVFVVSIVFFFFVRGILSLDVIYCCYSFFLSFFYSPHTRLFRFVPFDFFCFSSWDFSRFRPIEIDQGDASLSRGDSQEGGEVLCAGAV